MSQPRAPHIGIFDSGIGGLSVLRALRRRLPQAQFTYVADGRYTPWGERPTDWVLARSEQLAAWLIDSAGADLVLVACNTATTQAIEALRRRWPGRPFVGVEPGIKPAAAASRNGHVGVMATTGTLSSARMAELIQRHAGAVTVHRVPCPGLAEAIEREAPADAHLSRLLDAAAQALRISGADTVALGCTHYPLVAEALAERLPATVQLIDTADAVARRAQDLLALAATSPLDGSAKVATTALRLLSTGDPQGLQLAARRWIDPAANAGPLDLPPL